MKKYIRSFTTDELKAQLGDNYPQGGYLYIFKHGIGPGTIPSDVKVVKTKDLPNYYTAVWLDRFLTTPELKQYDIPDETRINELLGRIGYCQKNGDVVPCDGVTATTVESATKSPKFEVIRDDDGEISGYKLGNWYLMKIYSWSGYVNWYILDNPTNYLSEYERSKMNRVDDNNPQGYVLNMREGKKILLDRYNKEFGGDVQACGDVMATKSVCASTGSKVVYDKDGIKVTEVLCSPSSYIDSEDCLAVIENNTDKDYYVCGSGFDDFYVPAHDHIEIYGDEEGYATVNYFKWKDVPPLTKDQVKDLWDKKSLFIDWGDGSDSLCQENNYPLDEILEYMDQGCKVYIDEDPTEVNSCSDVKAATESNAPDMDKSQKVQQLLKQAREIRDYFKYHNNNLNSRQDQLLEDLSDGIDSESTTAIRNAIENLKYNSKNMRQEQFYLIEDLYNEFNFAGGKFEGMGRPGSEEPEGFVKVDSSTKYKATMVNASDEGYAQLAEGDEENSTWEEPKYHASSYYGTNYSGLEDDFATDDPSALVDWIWEHAAHGGYIEVEGPKNRIRLNPDALAEEVELGGLSEYDIISQIDFV